MKCLSLSFLPSKERKELLFVVDMTALKQMGENDLKELGIPMYPGAYHVTDEKIYNLCLLTINLGDSIKWVVIRVSYRFKSIIIFLCEYIVWALGRRYFWLCCL
ncbi:hypothetical protein ES332_A10G205200v1 [Gossypium tomentosum]|uniref:Uncharacterized protein n=1 Tax=Gossypium tomentosum TaxID=34277 RepID=A0A5D2NUL0_GOSTO|nr:hypothetical protein ES332_A10G205200v1 [Gossypium tomentosum]